MALPNEFCNLEKSVAGLKVHAAYYFCDNFIGRRVDGYNSNTAIGTLALASGLARALEINSGGFGLLVWDAYRPTRAVRDFETWASLPEDFSTKAIHYPNVDKSRLFDLGYIASTSSHSRGSTVDLTLTGADGIPLDMGTCFDFMDELSHHGAPVAPAQARLRENLRQIMTEAGFKPYANEWWHYTLIDEPFPNEYFDFAIK